MPTFRIANDLTVGSLVKDWARGALIPVGTVGTEKEHDKDTPLLVQVS